MSVKETKRVVRRHRRSAPKSARPKKAIDTLYPPAYFRWKAIFDRVLAVLMLAPGLPLIALLVFVVRLTSRGPGIYRQVRVGRNGRKFQIYKIRTMCHDAESDTGPVWTQTSHDPRVTAVGRILRQFHLDELPQLLNVVKGEMSLVGPRPERPEFVRVLAESIPTYRQRLMVPPGVTGLAQLNLPPDSDLNSVRRKVSLDCEYIREAGPWLDIRILLCTALRMLKLSEGQLLPLLRLRRAAVLDLSGTSTAPGGNGNGRVDGCDHVPATPAEILCQAAAESVDGKGNGRSGKETHARHVSVNKPR
jgi:lipopolysaccharide/colanic/teichoic acid biosynthesis glycosyltransferase